MIDRRKLIRLAISGHHGEQPFLDFKESLDLSGERGRGQLVKAICALANSNPTTSSYLIVGVKDATRTIIGTHYLDDQRIQTLVRNHFDPAPALVYENVRWPEAGADKFVGLLRIAPSRSLVRVARHLWKLKAGAYYFRHGSESVEGAATWFVPRPEHAADVLTWERSASSSLSAVLEAFSAFQTQFGSDMRYCVFHDQHVVCWYGARFDEAPHHLLSEVWVELLPERITQLSSCFHPVDVQVDESSFSLAEYVCLWWKGEKFVTPFALTRFEFLDDGRYENSVRSILQVPRVTTADIDTLVARCCDITAKARAREPIDESVWYEAESLPYELAVAALNGSSAARQALEHFLEGVRDGALAESQVDALRLVQRVSGEALT